MNAHEKSTAHSVDHEIYRDQQVMIQSIQIENDKFVLPIFVRKKNDFLFAFFFPRPYIVCTFGMSLFCRSVVHFSTEIYYLFNVYFIIFSSNSHILFILFIRLINTHFWIGARANVLMY